MKRRAQGQRALNAAGLFFDSRNDGAHLVVYGGGRVFDFWPGTGKWADRFDSEAKTGVSSLLKQIKNLKKKAEMIANARKIVGTE